MPTVGRKAPNKTHTQSVVFWKDAGWTETTSRKWCEDHDYYTDGLDENDSQYRWRQYDPEEDRFRYRNQEIEPDSITLVLGFPISEEGAENMKVIDTAIAVHHTATDTESEWDGPREVAQAPNDAKVLKYMHAWMDAEGDPEAKGTYKFPHHKAGSDTPAVIKGVNNALSRLPNSDIPEADQPGVEAHLRAHRKDAGLEDNAGDLLSQQIVSKHEPIRCFEGSAEPHEPFWTWHNAIESEPESEPEMELYGYISEYSWWEDDVSPRKFKDDLYKYGAGGPITIRMNSYGGDVIAASLMNTIIRDYPGRVTVKIDGVAASAATVVAVAGDVVKMQETAYFMIHDPLVLFFFAALNIEDLTRLAGSLQAIKEGIMNAYETKTSLSRPRLSRLMTDETWMDAQRAVDLGFIDEVITAGQKAIVLPKNTAVVNALQGYKNVPPAVLQALNSSPLTDDMHHQAQALRERVNSILRKEEPNA